MVCLVTQDTPSSDDKAKRQWLPWKHYNSLVEEKGFTELRIVTQNQLYC